ncbi:hypothetical protein KPATCC21470_2971 [Kitasatospora purpeofusca]
MNERGGPGVTDGRHRCPSGGTPGRAAPGTRSLLGRTGGGRTEGR